jgi:hypothetical protein
LIISPGILLSLVLEQLRCTLEYLDGMKQRVDVAIKSARRRERYNLR